MQAMSVTAIAIEMGSRSRSVEFHTDVVTVGRGPACDVVLPFDWVQSEHFSIHWRAGLPYARAIAGQTLHNGTPLPAEFTALHPGDELRIPSPVGKPITLLIQTLGSPALFANHQSFTRPDDSGGERAGEEPHFADSHMAAITAVASATLVCLIGFAIYLAFVTPGKPKLGGIVLPKPAAPTAAVNSTVAKPTAGSSADAGAVRVDPPATPAEATFAEASAGSAAGETELPKALVPPAGEVSTPAKAETDGRETVTKLDKADARDVPRDMPPEVVPPPSSLDMEMVNARAATRKQIVGLLSDSPAIDEPMRSQAVQAATEYLARSISPSTLTIAAEAGGIVVNGDGRFVAVRTPLTITNARGAAFRTRAVLLLTPAAAGFTVTYCEIQ